MDYSPTTRQVLRLLLDYRRRHGAAPDAPGDEDRVRACHGPVIEAFVRAGDPIHALLPAFPCKSPSVAKVLGRLPDMAERQSLIFLEELFRDIETIHAPGARLTICSDGRVFADCLGIPDDDIGAYRRSLQTMCEQECLSHIDFFSLEDVPAYAPWADEPATLRRRFDEIYGVVASDRRDSLLAYPGGRELYAAVTRFLVDDLFGADTQTSRTQRQKIARKRAAWLIARSDAWGRLLADLWPHALRLSIHPQDPDTPKLGIRMLDAPDDWLTPWHAVLLDEHGDHRLVHRRSLEPAMVVEVTRDGRPSHMRRLLAHEIVDRAGRREQPGLGALPGNPTFGASLDIPSLETLPQACEVLGLVRRHGFMLIRSADHWPDRTAMEAFCTGLGALLEWPGGAIVEVAERHDATDHVHAADAIALHWDGMYLPEVPELQVFSCRETSGENDGRTRFIFTPGILHAASREDRECWEGMVGFYSRRVASYAGRVRAPVVQPHPLHGHPVIRYCEAASSGMRNPAERRLTGGGSDTEAAAAALDAAMAAGPFVYLHTWRKGDIVITDNLALLHGREAFATGSNRCLWRAHVHAPEPLANAHLVRGTSRFAKGVA